jgi:hypothetical protein
MAVSLFFSQGIVSDQKYRKRPWFTPARSAVLRGATQLSAIPLATSSNQ